MIEILVEGYLRKENGILREAHSTVTAIIQDDLVIIVDTSSKEYRHRLLESLEQKGIDRHRVDIVVLTHAHADHISNLDLFPQAKILAHPLENLALAHCPVTDDELLSAGIRILHTPGHTAGSISVYVENEQCIIAGDALPTAENISKNLPPGICIDREMAIASMQKILSQAKCVIPGHGKEVHLPL